MREFLKILVTLLIIIFLYNKYYWWRLEIELNARDANVFRKMEKNKDRKGHYQ